MKKILFLVLVFFAAAISKAQNIPTFGESGGGGFDPNPKHLACISPEEHQRIEAILELKKKELASAGKPGSVSPLATPQFDWPVRQAAGRNLYANYGISNFVDHDVTFPNHVRDYSGGNRTYDLTSGYNHQGTDIYLWPFHWKMMENKDAEIVAAAAGTILHKEDGNFDRNCDFSNGDWNAVYLQHPDGSVTWYGHMKNGSLTSKLVGAQVLQGEFLGNVGSSGASTAPHLHFEVYGPGNKLIDPWSGPSNPSTTSSWWISQRPYIDPQINALMTHTAPPNFGNCPQTETTNTRDIFLPGSTIYFIVYYHDQTNAAPTNFRIRRPDNSVYQTWSITSDQQYYSSSYWYQSYVNVNGPLGDWKYEADYNGKSYSHTFKLSSNEVTSDGRSKAAIISSPVYRTDESVEFDYSLPGSGKSSIKVYNAVGKCIESFSKTDQGGTNSLRIESSRFPAGAYFLTVENGSSSCRQKFVVLR